MRTAALRRATAVLAAAAAATVPAVVPAPAHAASLTVVVNEVGTSKTGAYVELRNLRNHSVDVSGWSIWTCQAYQRQVLRLVTVPAGHTIPPNGYYLVAGNAYTGSPSPDLMWQGGNRQVHLPSVRVTDATGRVVDQVGAEDTNPCVEGRPPVAPLSASTSDRFALGRSSASDNDDNRADFGDVVRSPAASGQRTAPAVPPTPLHDLGGDRSGETHTIEGVVTGIDDRTGSSYDRLYPEQRGIFVQEEDADADRDPRSSEGIFVADVDRPADYRPGDVVSVKGVVVAGNSWPALPRSIKPKQATGGGIAKVGTAPLPEPVDVDATKADAEGNAYFETLTGMRVRLAESVANSGGTNKFGEVFVTPGTERRRLFRTDSRKGVLGIVDDAGAGNPDNSYKDRSSSTRLEVDLFDQLDDVVGPLGWSFENWKIFPQPGALPRVRPYQGTAYPLRLGRAAPGEVRIVSFNVENFFPVGVPVGGRGTERTPQGVPTEEEYAAQRAEILTALDDVLGRPDVVAIQEVYADDAGVSTALRDLAERLSRGSETYTPYVADSNDARGIANAYLVKSTVEAGNPRLLGGTEAGCGGRLFDRPPFAIDVRLGEHTVTLLNNHFKSKGGMDQGVPCREEQARFVEARVADIERAGGQAIVLGDLNSFEDETPLGLLESPSTSTLDNLWDTAPEQERYSYAYQGRLQTLDHVLATDLVARNVRDFAYVPIDTDFADRWDAAGRPVADGHALSDHNPPVLTLPAALSAEPEVVVPEAPWAALLLLGGFGAAFGVLVRSARGPRPNPR